MHGDTIADYSYPVSKTVIDTFPFAGLYPVMLIVTDTNGMDTTVKNINVNEYLLSGFKYAKASGMPLFTVHFEDTTKHSQTITSRTWKFHDTTISYNKDTLAQINHLYPAPGNYPVKLIVVDNSGHSDTTNLNINITAELDAGFSSQNLNFPPYYRVQFTDTSVSDLPIGGRTWMFHDDTLSYSKDTMAQITHNYSSPGVYSVKLAIKDTMGNKDTITHFVDVTKPLNADFSFNQDTNTTAAPFFKVDFTDTSSSIHSIVSRTWVFPDTTYKDTSAHITHAFPSPDNYSVKLILTDSTGLSDTSKKTIILKNAPKAHISGSVSAGQGSVNDGFAVLYKKGVNQPMIPYDTSDIIKYSGYSYFYFSDVDVDNFYRIRAQLRQSDSLYHDYIPTYFGNKERWSVATDISVDSVYVPAPIDLISCGEFGSGMGKISGHVTTQNQNKPLPDVNIILHNNTQDPVEITNTDKNGYYEFKNLPLQNVSVRPEDAGFFSGNYYVKLNNNKQNIGSVDFILIDSTYVPDSANTGIEQKAIDAGITVYPNPVDKKLKIETNKKVQLNAINLLTVNGRLITRKMLTGNEKVFTVDISDLKPGFVIVKIVTESGEFYKKVIVQ